MNLHEWRLGGLTSLPPFRATALSKHPAPSRENARPSVSEPQKPARTVVLRWCCLQATLVPSVLIGC
ncbi:uncharacterized protein THITE_2108185 [Thermothielavioides terrestris NRRL 8126]|uniref:Uncharacterized protein n=1 Tax=Thermothielavioides terrestris (strain ATCC 38088 / NRRL 8126) TaxID=578455 RepID=G2QXW3_THETT|nr:uncharacterized protein THITE_2108185 [Thermothielavioides terrestris NRRL 8126]AEO63231.1 hypothetical protein THITE_2108185 [Thermothielavioides terrestris NRRL 8126]